jgi:hypothetical protein
MRTSEWRKSWDRARGRGSRQAIKAAQEEDSTEKKKEIVGESEKEAREDSMKVAQALKEFDTSCVHYAYGGTVHYGPANADGTLLVLVLKASCHITTSLRFLPREGSEMVDKENALSPCKGLVSSNR